MNEIEIKLKVGDFEGIRDKLLEMDFVLEAKDEEACIFFDDISGNFSKENKTIRIKKGSDWASFVVKVKGYDRNYKVAEEYQTDVTDSEAMTSALLAMGLVKAFEYSKEREHWTNGPASVELDYIPEIGGYFVEVEAVGGAEIEEIIAVLGLQNAERDKRSYPDIVKEKR